MPPQDAMFIRQNKMSYDSFSSRLLFIKFKVQLASNPKYNEVFFLITAIMHYTLNGQKHSIYLFDLP